MNEQKTRLLFRERQIKELEEYIASGGCCDGCRTGTADCDVNPLRKPPTLEEAKAQLKWLRETP